jgi:hypothetical protein
MIRMDQVGPAIALLRSVIARWPEPRFRGVDLGFPQNK